MTCVDIFFNNGGFQGFSYLFSLVYLIEYGFQIRNVYGSSGGCFAALVSVLYSSPDEIKQKFNECIEEVKKKLSLEEIIKNICIIIFKDDNDFIKCNNKLHIISCCREGYSFKPKVFNEFTSNQNVIDCIIASCHIPYVTCNKMGHFINNTYYYDGYLGGWTPSSDVIHIQFYLSEEYRWKNMLYLPDDEKLEINGIAAIRLTVKELIRLNLI